MTEAASNYQTITTATTEGLDDLFAAECKSSESDAGPSREALSMSQDDGPGPSQFLSALEAADLLGINKRSVIRLIQEQKLKAIKRDGRYFIERQAVDERKQRVSVAGPSRDEDPVECLPVDIEGPGPSQGIVYTSRGDVPPTSQDVDFSIQEEIPSAETSASTIDAYQLLRDLEAATYRIGYLEAQLESERNQVKLLTDRLHKPVWWHRFCAWFIGNKFD